MSETLGIVTAYCIWALTFRKFFGNFRGFINTVKILVTTDIRKVWRGDAPEVFSAQFHLMFWIALGGFTGLIVQLVSGIFI